MKANGTQMCLALSMACVLTHGLHAAGEITPVIPSTQSVEQASSVQPVAVATSVTDGGRYVLTTVTSKGFRSGGSGQVPETVLLDMETGGRSLVSVAADGGQGNGASGGGQIGGNGVRIAFESRASNLVDADTNGAWDVFVRDLDVNRTRLVSFGTNGAALRGYAVRPQLSEGGRWVLADHGDPNHGSRSKLLKDLETGTTVVFASGGGGILPELWDARFASKSPWLAGLALGGAELADGFGILRRDLGAGTNQILATRPSPHWFGSPAISADGRLVAWCRVERRPATTNILEYFDTETGETVVVASRTNQWSSGARETWRLLPAWSPENRWLVCPLPEQPEGTTNLFTQLYLWDRETQQLALITGAADHGGAGSGDSILPLVGPGASNVVFLSDATNLVTGGLTSGRRVFRWERAKQATTVLFDVSGQQVLPEPVLSADGGWLAVAEAEAGGAVTVRVVDMRTGAVTARTFPPAVASTVTRRGPVWLSEVQSSLDGRWLASLEAPDEASPVQVYVTDTQNRERRLASVGVDGKPAAANCWGLGVSNDGERVAFLSAANNLIAGKTGSWLDVQVYSRSQGQLLGTAVAWRGPNVVPATMNFALSADGRWLALESDTVRLVDLGSGASSSVTLSGLRARPVFSANGARVMFDAATATSRAVAVHNVALLAAGQPSEVWATNGLALTGGAALSSDGTYLAFTMPVQFNGSRLTVVDIGTGLTVFSQEIQGPATGRLTMHGTRLLWEGMTSPTQVWLADVASGGMEMVSVGADGVMPGDGSSRFPVISQDGRWVAFASAAGNLVPEGGRGVKQVYLRDTSFGRTFLVSHGLSGMGGDGWSTFPWFQEAGAKVCFVSAASDLVAGDLNMVPDVYSVLVVDAGELVVLVEPSPSAGKSKLRWSGKPRVNYGLQFKGAIEDSWLDLPGSAGTASEIEIDHSGGARFFRVVERP